MRKFGRVGSLAVVVTYSFNGLLVRLGRLNSLQQGHGQQAIESTGHLRSEMPMGNCQRRELASKAHIITSSLTMPVFIPFEHLAQ